MLAAALLFLPAIAAAASGPIRLSVDAADAAQRIFHVREEIPVSAGALTLYFVKWIPGEHSPSGQVVNLVNLHISHDGQPLAWRRDPVDMFAFHSTVPAQAPNR